MPHRFVPLAMTRMAVTQTNESSFVRFVISGTGYARIGLLVMLIVWDKYRNW
jgi:hypothetical protein